MCKNSTSLFRNVTLQRYSLFCLFENKKSCFLPRNCEKRTFFYFFKQKNDENIFLSKKSCTFASHLSLGLWCNGNTADSGPAFPGSSPGSPTERFPFGNLFFLCNLCNKTCKAAHLQTELHPKSFMSNFWGAVQSLGQLEILSGSRFYH